MKSNILNKCLYGQECTSCLLCASICPTNAITIDLTDSGFYRPSVDEKKCIDCSKCKRVCYKFDEKIQDDCIDKYTCYSAINNNNSELLTSTSGGVSNEIMKECLRLGYKIIGVSYDYNNNRAISKIVDNV